MIANIKCSINKEYDNFFGLTSLILQRNNFKKKWHDVKKNENNLSRNLGKKSEHC